MSSERAVIVVEDDRFPRILQVVLDPATSPERCRAFAHLVAHEVSDFQGWLADARAAAAGLYPADVRLVSSQVELRAQLPEAMAIIVESLRIGPSELELARRLKVVYKYGTVPGNIDVEQCEARGIAFLTLRRRLNVGVAEHVFALMGLLAKKLHVIRGRISFEQLRAAGYEPQRLDPEHIPTSGWARVTGLRLLYESSLGIIGMGEIGREVAQRAAAFGMRSRYFQRTRLSAAEELRFKVEYVPLDELLEQSDWITIHVPENATTRGLIGQAAFARMKPGAFLINTARASIVEREALLAALRSGRLGGVALDTLYEEPGRAEDELLRFDNVIMTPHVAGGPRVAGLEDFMEIIRELARTVPSTRR